MTTHRWPRAAAVLVVAWLATSFLLPAQGTPQVVSIPDFRLTVPPGKWAIERDVPNAHVTLLATRSTKLGPRAESRIDVRVVRPDPERRLAPAAAAAAALATEVSGLDRRAAGSILTTTPRDTTIGCRLLAGARYRMESRSRRTMGEETGMILAWAPPEYPATGRVVLFRLTTIERGATGLFPDGEAAFLKVVETLELQSSAAGIIC